jgi:hypothetical protein
VNVGDKDKVVIPTSGPEVFQTPDHHEYDFFAGFIKEQVSGDIHRR